MIPEISKRLNVVANAIKKTKTIADIGTDHAYVPIYLCKTKKVESAIACDINKGPLQKAEMNIKKYNLDSKIVTRLCSGLEKIEPNEVEAIVIAGMGGKLMIDILDNKPETVQTLRQIVLQPQLDVCEVRKYIHAIGFCIENEEMIIEDDKYYNIISAIPGVEKYNSEIDYIGGKLLIERKSTVLKAYLEININKYNIIIEKLNIENTPVALQRKEILTKEMESLLEVYKCI